MSIYGYLVCHDCRQMLWLGKAIHGSEHIHYFHIGSKDDPPNWSREVLNQVVWKFLADHCGHKIDVRIENEMSEEMFGYQDIDDVGDGENCITLEKYLEGWRGKLS